MRKHTIALPAHVALETTSALSRMPQGRRIAPEVVFEALDRAFPKRWLVLTEAEYRAALRRAVGVGIRGGALYDALIAATAAKHGAELLSADSRARGTYEMMGADAIYLKA